MLMYDVNWQLLQEDGELEAASLPVLQLYMASNL